MFDFKSFCGIRIILPIATVPVWKITALPEWKTCFLAFQWKFRCFFSYQQAFVLSPASVGPYVKVDVHVIVQGALVYKPLSTLLTVKLFLAVCCVQACHVILQGSHLLSTYGASGLLTVGLLHVTFYVGCRIKFSTVLTGDLLFVGRWLVIVQPFPGGKYPGAYLTLRWRLWVLLLQRQISMHSALVVFQLAALDKCLQAQWTFTWEHWSMLPLHMVQHSFFLLKIYFAHRA